MASQHDLAAMDRRIRRMRELAEQLARMGQDFPALACNTARILTSIKMLELNVCEIADLAAPTDPPSDG